MKYGPEKTKEICSYLEKGNSRNDAFLLCDVGESTFYEWMQIAEFAEAVKKAELKCKDFHIGIIKKAAEKTWQAAAWWLERKHWEEYSQKQKADHTVSPDAALRMAETTLRLMRELNAGTKTTEHARV